MSSTNNHDGSYLLYTEYYIISGVYEIVNVVNEILTYSASCSDNIKGYLHNKVVTKKASLHELMRNQQYIYNDRNNGNENNDIDEDGFVVIKMRRPKKNKNEHDRLNNNSNNSNNSSSHDKMIINNNDNNNDIIQKVIENIIRNVIIKLDTNAI
jgi:hypothetical protein